MAPTSANVSRTPRSTGSRWPSMPPPTRTGTYSRVWSVETSVGSQPWSPVMNRSPPAAASSSSGTRWSKASTQPAYPSGSLRWPNSVSKSTRLATTSPGSSRPAYSMARSTPWSFDSECRDSVSPRPTKMSGIFPTPYTGTPAACTFSR